MGQNSQTRTIKIEPFTIQSELDGSYPLSFAIQLTLSCMGQIQNPFCETRYEYTDWIGGTIFSGNEGIDAHTHWIVLVTPYASPANLKGSHVNCIVSAPQIVRFVDWQQSLCEIEIDWGVEAVA